jgi:phosphoribosyl-ATP pyrophosphohydrolase
VSTTSRLLHTAKPHLEDRLADELVELIGVLRGTHRHDNPAADVVLEASQCFYWLALLSARQQLSASDWLAPLTRLRPPVERDQVIETLILAAEYWGEFASERELNNPLRLTSGTAITIADAVRAAGVDVGSVFATDLSGLHSRPYLATYFEMPST